jgi:WD40 repeat protein
VSGFESRACDTASEGRIVFLGKSGDETTLTELAPGECRALAQSLHAPLGFWLHASISSEGRILALSSAGGLELWDLRTTQRLAVWPVGHCTADFDQSGRLIVACEAGVYRWPRHVENFPAAVPEIGAASSAVRTVVRLGPPEKLTGPIVQNSLSTNASGKSLVFEDASGWAVLHTGDSALVRLQTRHDPRKGAVSPDNRYAAIANWNSGGAAAWDAASGAHLADLAVGRCGVVQFSPDGRLLAATPDGVTLWRTGDWQRIRELHAHGTTPTGLGIAFSPDSRVLAVGQPNGVLRLVDPFTGNDWARLTHSDLNVHALMAFSRDQRYLVTSSIDGRSPAHVWDLRAMRSELVRRGLDWPADVLTVAAAPPLEGQLEVVLDDGGLIHMRDSAQRLWQNAVNLLQRARQAAKVEKAAE